VNYRVINLKTFCKSSPWIRRTTSHSVYRRQRFGSSF